MQVQVTSDNHVRVHADQIQAIGDGLRQELSRYAGQITTVEVHLADINGPRHGDDKRCLIEARLAGLAPVVASHLAGTVDDAVDGASEKLHRALDHVIGRLHDPKGQKTSFGGDQVI